MKKLLAILCVAALVFCSLFTGVAVSADTAGLTEYTPTSVGLPQNTHLNYVTRCTLPNSGAFVDAAFTAEVIIKDRILFGRAGGEGIRIAPVNTAEIGIYQTDYIKAQGAVEGINLKGDHYKLRVEFISGDFDDDAEADDMRVIVFVNDVEATRFDFVENFGDKTPVEEFSEYVVISCWDAVVWDIGYTIPEKMELPFYEGLTRLVPSDFTAESDFYGRNAATNLLPSLLDSYFDADVYMETNSVMKYPMLAGQSGIQIWSDSATTIDINNQGFPGLPAGSLKQVNPAEVGLKTLKNGFNLKVVVKTDYSQFEQGYYWGDSESDEPEYKFKTDVVVTILINDVNVYEYRVEGTLDPDAIEKVEDENGVSYNGEIEGGISLYYDEDGTQKPCGFFAANLKIVDGKQDIPVLNEVYLEEVAYTTDFAAAEANTKVGYAQRLDETLNVDLVINDSEYGFPMGTAGSIVLDKDTKRLKYEDVSNVVNQSRFLTPAGVDYTGKRFNLKISYQNVDHDSINDTANRYPNDLKMGIWIDDSLAGGSYIYCDNRIPYFVSAANWKVDIIVPAGSTLKIFEPVKAPSNLNQLSPADFGFDSNVAFPLENTGSPNLKVSSTDEYYNYGNYTYGLSILNSVLTAKVKINTLPNKGNLQVYYGQNGNGVKVIIRTDNKVNFGVGDYFFINGVDLPEVGTEFTLQVVVQESDIDANADGVYDDYRLGLLINNQLAGGKYYLMSSIATDKAAAQNCFTRTDAKLFIYDAYANTADITVTGATNNDDYLEYDVISASDYNIEPGTYTSSTANMIHAINSVDAATGSQNGKVIKETFNFSSGIGDWTGLYLFSHYLRLAVDSAGKARIVSALSNEKYELPDFEVGVAQEYMFSYLYENGSLKLGIWIDGKLQFGRYIYMAGLGDECNPTFGIHYEGLAAENDYSVTVGDGVNYTNTELVDGAATVVPPSGTTYTYNEQAIPAEGYTFTEIGEYVIGVSTEGAYYKLTGTKTLVVYKDKDFNGDNTVDIIDFVIAQKNALNIRPLTTRVALAAAGKADADDLINAIDLIAVKRAILFG